MPEDHPFNRYADFTDLALLKEYSVRPLRRCVRVNTILSSAEQLKQWGEGKGWQLTQVPWCKEGFFVEREDRTIPLGKDLMHLLGHFYFQEASSMLPVELLDPQPGENILDMAAAPGSKSTQIAAKMSGRGVLVANDMEDRRIKTLREALNRSGVTNVVITKKIGQWFGTNMTGRFDRVLIDAPCTAQGTTRKDADALNYTSEHSIGKAAKLQRELLESAVHAAKIGGRIVYSTCTLCPEENEEVVLSILNKFSTQLEVTDPREMSLNGAESEMNTSVKNSLKVQEGAGEYPFLRLWPQTYDTEGFFCAVLTKTAPTRPAEKVEIKHLREQPLPAGIQREMKSYLRARYGTDIVFDDEYILDRGDHLVLTTESVMKFKLPVVDYAAGLPFGKRLRDVPVYIDHEMAVLRGAKATDNICTVDEERLQQLLQGKDISCDPSLLNHVLLLYKGFCIGRGRAYKGTLKNHLPRWMIYHLQDVV